MEAGTLLLAFLLQSLLLVSVNCKGKPCEKIDDCSCKKSNGKTMSLHPIDANPGPEFKDIKMTKDGTIEDNVYGSWNPCTRFSNGKGCQNVLICQSDKSSNPVLTYPIGTTVESYNEELDGSITMMFKEDSTYDGYARQGVLLLKCDKGKKPGDLTEFIETPSTGPKTGSRYTATFSSQCICDGGCPDVPGGSNGSRRPSIGSTLLIVFLPLVFIYFVGGILYNKYKKGANTFGEMVPNHSFWSELPFLVKDGCIFTFHGVAGCCSSLCMKIKGDSYAKI